MKTLPRSKSFFTASVIARADKCSAKTVHRRAEIFRAHNRFAAISGLSTAIQNGMQFERALTQVARDFTFHCHPNSLRRWHLRFSKDGFAGLLEKKRGNSGRQSKARR